MSQRASTSPGSQLRKLVATSSIQVPGVPNALAGRLAQQMGFRACYLSGGAFSAGVLALPDIGLFTSSELCEHTKQLARSVEIPIIVDADTGFGEAVNVARTIEELEVAGAAAIQLEDQQLPKRCGHLSGKSLVSVQHMCEKIVAAVSARHDPELVIIARTDARGVQNLEEALVRAKAYVAAGADWIFPEGLMSRQEFQQFASQMNVPLVANMTEFGKSPLLPFHELSGMGYAVVLYPVTLLRIALKAMRDALATIQQEGSQESLLERMQTRQELYDLLGYEDYEQQDKLYFGNTASK